MSKKKRIKKIVKGHLTQKQADGADKYAAGATRQGRSDTLDAMTNAQLITALSMTDAGKPGLEAFDIDADGATFKNDVQPFDIRENADKDGDGIGDNRDILLTKLVVDNILFSQKDGGAGPGTGSLSTTISVSNSIEASVTSLVTAHDAGNAGVKTTKQGELQTLITGDAKYSEAGIDSMTTSIASDKAEANAALAAIATMTPAAAASNIVIADGDHYALAPYNAAGGSKKAFDDAAAALAANEITTPADSQTTKLAGKADAVASILKLAE